MATSSSVVMPSLHPLSLRSATCETITFDPVAQFYYCGKCGSVYTGVAGVWPSFDSPCCGSGAWTTGEAMPRQFYRFHESRYSGDVVMLVKSTFAVIKETPAGVWLDVYGSRRFVKTDARKRFACPTEAEALESYYARKRRQVKILRAQLAAAEAALTLKTDGETAPTQLFGLP